MNGWALVEESTKRNLEGATAEFDVALSKAVIEIGDASIKNAKVISDQCNMLKKHLRSHQSTFNQQEKIEPEWCANS